MKKVISIVFMAAVLLVAGYFITQSNTDESVDTSQATTNQKEQTDSTSQTDTDQAPVTEVPDPLPEDTRDGAYVDYSETTLAEANGVRLLFFHAPWCPQCRALEEDIQSSGVRSGVTVLKIDYDKNQELRQKYGVTIQTTIVRVNENGELIDKYVAYQEPTIASVEENLL